MFRTHMAVVLLLATWTLLLSAACSPSGSLPAEYLGEWVLEGTSGGIDGMHDPAADDLTVLTLSEDNLATLSREGTVLNARRFRVWEGDSIYGPAWMLEYEAGEGQIREQAALRLTESGTLVIGDNNYDGYSSTYSRR